MLRSPDCALRKRQPDGRRHPLDQFIISNTPAARWGGTDGLKGPDIFLASSASDFVNGHIFYVDGGILVQASNREVQSNEMILKKQIIKTSEYYLHEETCDN